MTATSPLRLGLTGGIGSGKSTVAQMFAARGAVVIDSDAIARSVTAANGPAMPAIAEAFGKEFVTPEGALDRDRMRALVFSDPSAKQRLEAIVHPLVGMATQAQAQNAMQQYGIEQAGLNASTGALGGLLGTAGGFGLYRLMK